MSIINGENIQVIGGAYSNTHGTAPAAGIDIESNSGTAVPGNNNILIRGVTFAGNDGYGVQLDPMGQPTNITVEGCNFSNNHDGGVWLGTSWTLIKANTFENFSESIRGIIDLPAVNFTNSNNVITGNSFNNIGTGQAVIYAHQYSGTNSQVYSNKYYNISGSFLETHTTGTTGWDNVLTTSPTYPTTSSDPIPSPSPDPATSGSVINGTSGDDQFVATANAETFNGYDGTDGVSYVNSSSAVTVQLWNGTGAGGHAEGDTLISIENVAGSIYNDRLEGTDGSNRLDGLGGNDSLLGLGGNDLIMAGAGSDTLFGGDGNDVIYGGDGTDLISGGVGLDTLYGGGADDWMYGNGDADVMSGNAGNDWMYGGDGNDTMYGNEDGDHLYGEAGNDLLYGGPGADTLDGGLGIDTLRGGDGNDLLCGGAGNDRLSGEAGADNYVFNASVSGKDVIVDFDVTADHVVLAPNLNGNGIYTAAQALAHVHAGAHGYAVLDLGGGNTVTFQGVTPSQLGTEDFVISSVVT
jgi:parallel beta-helix repeat protein